MKSSELPYGFTRKLEGVSFETAIEKATAALKAEGFGILTSIDVKETFQKKLGKDFRRYVILGACNPQIAYQALSEDLGIGLLLPCNVCVYEENKHQIVVQIVSPRAMFAAVERPDLEPMVQEAESRLRRVSESI